MLRNGKLKQRVGLAPKGSRYTVVSQPDARHETRRDIPFVARIGFPEVQAFPEAKEGTLTFTSEQSFRNTCEEEKAA